MKRLVMFFVAAVVCLGWFLAPALPWLEAAAEDNRTIAVEVVIIGDKQGAEGQRCGYLDLGADPGPVGRQVVVTDAEQRIVGTVDLFDIFDLQASENAFPGQFDGDGFCRVQGSVTAPDSPYYTFSIDGEYRWTMARSALESRDWAMQIQFSR